MPPTGSRARRLAKDLNDVHLLGQQCELCRQRTRADVELVTESYLGMSLARPCVARFGCIRLCPPASTHQGRYDEALPVRAVVRILQPPQ